MSLELLIHLENIENTMVLNKFGGVPSFS